MYVLTCAPSLMWGPEDNFKEFLSYLMCLGDLAQAVRLEGKHLYSLSNLISPVMRIPLWGTGVRVSGPKQGEDTESNKECEDLQAGQKPSIGNQSCNKQGRHILSLVGLQ